MVEVKPGYYAIIPADVRYDDRIPANAKLLYGEISALIGSDGYCFATNQYFSDLYGMADETISRLISKLESAGHIKREMERDASGQIVSRKLFLRVSIPDTQPLDEKINTSPQKNQEGIDEKVKGTITSITNIDKKKNKQKKKAAADPFDPLPQFVTWIDRVFPDVLPHRKNSLYQALARFAANRDAIKKPMKSQAAVTALTNKLTEYCRENISGMIDLLDTATSSGWQSVYPPKTAQSRAAPQNSGQVVYKEI